MVVAAVVPEAVVPIAVPVYVAIAGVAAAAVNIAVVVSVVVAVTAMSAPFTVYCLSVLLFTFTATVYTFPGLHFHLLEAVNFGKNVF